MKKIKEVKKEVQSNLKRAFDKKRKMSPKVIYLAILLYALFGGYMAVITIQNETKTKWRELTRPVVITNQVEARDRESDDKGTVPEFEITDCNTAAEYWSKEVGVSEELLKKIIKAESGNNPHAKNPTSTASSCAQWLWGSWHNYGLEYWGDDFYNRNIWNPSDNVELMARTINKYGTSPWDASAHVWNK